MIRLTLEEGMEDSWQHSINYQVSYLLASVIDNIKSGEINFYTQRKSQDLLFCCDMKGEDEFGNKFYFSMRNSDGKLAIKDTVSRVRRELTRNIRHIN